MPPPPSPAHGLSPFPKSPSINLNPIPFKSPSPLPPAMPIDLADDQRSLSFGSQTISSSATSGSSSSSSSSCDPVKSRPVTFSADPYHDAIRRLANPDGLIAMSDLRFIQRLGSGDIGSVYLAEVKSADGDRGVVVAAKVMDKKELVGRNKSGRAKTEKEILEMLDHPFLPRLYGCAENERVTSLLTEFCPGGDLHVLRQRQPHKRFDEHAVRFYAAEVVAALEYIHMLGIIYRDLKPENVLVRSDGHIMLTDFDLSLKGGVGSSPAAQLVRSHQPPAPSSSPPPNDPFASATGMSACILPNCIVPAVSCFQPKRRRRRKPVSRLSGLSGHLVFVAEPVELRSMSFVGTHEYLAPEIISGEGHGSSVDWWTLGVFIFELLYGATPFKGADNEITLANIVARALDFPKKTVVTAQARDLIAGLLAKDPEKRLGSNLGATAVKRHPFFSGVNWALLRCAPPPHVPPPFAAAGGKVSFHDLSNDRCSGTPVEYF
ncbi:Serine/threonine-protein kinase KIPK [Platanthera zijinensis]|uniref:non-specific serine/threonine protein kinase n=1 Tax=Platanthera zijinensis TaxID=2320716 RepID=A0AAP0GF70_9ASPA